MACEQRRWLVLDTDHSANGPDWFSADLDGIGVWQILLGTWIIVILQHDVASEMFTTSIAQVGGDMIYERSLVSDLWNGFPFDITQISFGVEETST